MRSDVALTATTKLDRDYVLTMKLPVVVGVPTFKSSHSTEEHRMYAHHLNPLRYLSPEQRLKVITLLPSDSEERKSWYIYRIPSTGSNPHTLRLHKRDSNGALLQVISISEEETH